jgi:CRISPR-associated protein Cmr6
MRDPIVALAPRRHRAQNPGLLLQRYLAQQATGDNHEERRRLLGAARDAAGDSTLQTLYKQAYERLERSFPNAPDGTPPQLFTDLGTVGRMVIGLGAENVLETGLRLHHTYGLPIIPGSALKGLASHYCDHVWGQRHLADGGSADNKLFRREGQYHDLLFGFTREEEADAGGITFHDAWITPSTVPNCLCIDVMTPHHPDWQIEGKKPPTDFDSPNPVSFLSVTGTFRVGVSWAGLADHPQAKNWTELAFTLLKEALKEWGIGGKTSSGYGRLIPPPPPPPPPKRNSGDRARVKIIGPRATGFDVQDTQSGRKPGVLTVGSPPPGTPTATGSEVDVLVHNDDSNKPQYKWPPTSKK